MLLHTVEVTIKLDKDESTFFEELYISQHPVRFYSSLPQVTVKTNSHSIPEGHYEVLSRYVHEFRDETEFEINGFD